jgi:hypothetical protein
MNKKILFLLLAVATSFKVSASSPKELELKFLRSSFFNHFNDRLTAVKYLPKKKMFLLTFGQHTAQVSVTSLTDDRIPKLHRFCKKLVDQKTYTSIEEFRKNAGPEADLATTFQISANIEDIIISKQACMLL